MAFKFPKTTPITLYVLHRRTTNKDAAVLESDELLVQTDTTAAHTFSLISCSNLPPGKVYYFVDEFAIAGTHALTIQPSGGQTIDGAASYVINTNYGYLRIYNTGTFWKTW